MLIIISDLHLGDGTCGKSISASAFHLFSDRLRELAINASFRTGDLYRPIETVDILMLGDILEVLHSTRWLDTERDQPGYVRPWTDFRAPEFAATLDAITTDVLANNEDAIATLRGLTQPGGLTIPPAASDGTLDRDAVEQPVQVRLHYMIGNHDWYYHLTGPAFDKIRKKIIAAFGLSNPPTLFPYELSESGELVRLLNRYGVYAQHGDFYDSFNFPQASNISDLKDPSKKRDASSLGDVFAVEILNRFSVEAKREFKDKLSPELIESLSELVNVRPALATPLWISSQLRQNNVGAEEQAALKNLWDRLCKEFLKQPLVRQADKKWELDIVDILKLAVEVTDHISFKAIDDLVVWARKKFSAEEEIKFSSHALKEKAFQDRAAQFIVYGHTHHHEIVPLDSFPALPHPTNQMYINSGTWHTYFDLAVYKPEEQKFIPYQVLTYLSFFKDDERDGHRFETWSGAFSD
jgi:UDP-2,3-diacylglucosamine pyrophosphatase LpxH